MSRNGKIATLPRALREQINVRLDDGEEGEQLLDWLNQLPEVLELMKANFAGIPISKQNLSEWRQGGFREWLSHQEFAAHARRTTEYAEDIFREDQPLPADSLAMVLSARYCALVANWNGEVDARFEDQARLLRQLSQDVIRLQCSTRQAFKDHEEYAAAMARQTEEEERSPQKKIAQWLTSQPYRAYMAEKWGGGPLGQQVADYILASKLGLPETPLDLLVNYDPEKENEGGASQTQSKPVKPKRAKTGGSVEETPMPPSGL
ncbi:MAG TPA: hypothetical protein VFC44_19055 [Candidatus Saccharimonadales bacterium]|nr:hypothetical protein [Candidatus Saccharimonadales bacterium]